MGVAGRGHFRRRGGRYKVGKGGKCQKRKEGREGKREGGPDPTRERGSLFSFDPPLPPSLPTDKNWGGDKREEGRERERAPPGYDGDTHGQLPIAQKFVCLLKEQSKKALFPCKLSPIWPLPMCVW